MTDELLDDLSLQIVFLVMPLLTDDLPIMVVFLHHCKNFSKSKRQISIDKEKFDQIHGQVVQIMTDSASSDQRSQHL